MTAKEAMTASREELQSYLESRGFAVYDSEPVEDLRQAAIIELECERFNED